ncbi:MAG TPA: hypothetical protein VKQ30_08055 [Ktedonobacterales bacterium]|nr:hypothetical protein [Ktedonobacterales bacterium]
MQVQSFITHSIQPQTLVATSSRARRFIALVTVCAVLAGGALFAHPATPSHGAYATPHVLVTSTDVGTGGGPGF